MAGGNGAIRVFVSVGTGTLTKYGPNPIDWVSFMYLFGYGLWRLDPVEHNLGA